MGNVDLRNDVDVQAYVKEVPERLVVGIAARPRCVWTVGRSRTRSRSAATGAARAAIVLPASTAVVPANVPLPSITAVPPGKLSAYPPRPPGSIPR